MLIYESYLCQLLILGILMDFNLEVRAELGFLCESFLTLPMSYADVCVRDCWI